MWEFKELSLKTYLLFDDFSGIVVNEVKRFFFPKMEAMSKNDVEAETCEHAQNRKHGNALTKPKVEILLVLLLFRLPNTKWGQSMFKVEFNSASTFGKYRCAKLCTRKWKERSILPYQKGRKTQNWFAYCASLKMFVRDQRMISF